MVFVPNGAIGFHEGNFFLHRSYSSFLTELLDYIDRVVISQFVIFNPENSFYDWKLSDISRIDIDRIGICYSHSNRAEKILNYLVAPFMAARVVANGGFFYICMPGHIPIIYATICLLLRKRYALYVRGDWLQGCGKLRRRLLDLLLKKASFILVTGQNYLEKLKPLNQEVELVVPMIEVTEDDIYRDRNFAFGQQVNLLFLSRIERAKGIFDLLDAFEILCKEDSRLHLIIAGDGPDFTKVAMACEERGLERRVSLKGMIKEKDRLKEIYKKADLFIFPSYYPEGFPRVLYEAMCFALPIVTTFVGSIGSVMKDGENCLRIRKPDKNDIVAKSLDLLGDLNLREKIGLGAVETMEQLFKTFDKTSHARQLIEWAQRTKVFE